MPWMHRSWLALIVVFGFCSVNRADEPAVPVTEPTPATGAPVPAPAQLAPALNPDESKLTGKIVELPEAIQWIKELDDDQFEVREAAMKKFIEAGAPAAMAIKAVAQGEQLESATRAFTVLDKWLKSENAQTQAAARKVLNELASGPEEVATTRRAKNLLAKSQVSAPQPSLANAFGGAAPAVRLGVARMEVRAVAGFGGGIKAHSVRISVADGQKKIEVTEDGTKTEIVESEKEGIKIQVTSKDKKDKEGKPVVTEYQAKDLAELEKKQPEGFKLYQKHAAGMKGIQIHVQAAGVGVLEAVPVLKGLTPVELKKLSDEEKTALAKQRAAELAHREAEQLKQKAIEAERAAKERAAE